MEHTEIQQNIAEKQNSVELIQETPPSPEAVAQAMKEIENEYRKNHEGKYPKYTEEQYLLAILEHYLGTVKDKVIVNVGSAPTKEKFEPGNLFELCADRGVKKIVGIDVKEQPKLPQSLTDKGAQTIKGNAHSLLYYLEENNIMSADAIVCSRLFGVPLRLVAEKVKQVALRYADTPISTVHLKDEQSLYDSMLHALKKGGLVIIHIDPIESTLNGAIALSQKEDFKKLFPDVKILLWLRDIEKTEGYANNLSSTIVLRKEG